MFRKLYEEALGKVWEDFRELGESYREHATMFARDADEVITRLSQSTAFVVASILERLQEDGQFLLRPLLAGALPECLRPRAAATILELPAAKVRSANAEGARFDARGGMPFVIRWRVVPGPYELVDVRVERRHATLQTLHLTLQGRDGAALGMVLPEKLRFFLRLAPANAALDVLHALHSAGQPIEVATYDSKGERIRSGHLPHDAFSWVGVDSDEPSLSRAPAGVLPSSALLDDILTFPEAASFFDIAARAFCSEKVARLELTIPLARVLEHAATLNTTNVRLFCAPAVNEFEAAIEPIVTGDALEWMLRAADRPHAEILDVQHLNADTPQGELPLVSLEAPARALTLQAGIVYHRLRQTLAQDGSRTEARLSLLTREHSPAPAPGPLIQGQVLASDGARTSALGLGDVAGMNITRVAPARRAVLDRDIPKRMHAYARMSARQLAEPAHLDAFVRIHALSPPQHIAVATPRFVAMTHRPERQFLPGGCMQNGDEFKLWIDSSSCNAGEAYIICRRISDAFSERNELVRFSRLTVLRQSGVFTRFNARVGQR